MSTHTIHTRQAAQSLPDLTARLIQTLESLGYNRRDIGLVMAGARMFGHLRQGGALWYVEHQIDQIAAAVHPMDSILESQAEAALAIANQSSGQTTTTTTTK